MGKLLIVISFFVTINAQAQALKSPNVSANALILYRNSNFHHEDASPATPDAERNGLGLQEAEIAYYADVDPYTRLNMTLALHPEVKQDDPAAPTALEEEWVLEPEELYAESLGLPATTLRLGKFKAALGKHNQLHSHAFPFVDAPLANTALLGDEGLNDVGISAAVLLPTAWFSEATFQFMRGEGENEEFNSPATGDGVGVARWKNLFDLSDESTLELGLSGAGGGNSLRGTTALQGADLTFKWRPSEGGRDRSALVSLEYLNRRRDQPGGAEAEQGTGLAFLAQVQLAERWSAAYRNESLKIENSLDPATLVNDTISKNTLALNFSPSEFSSYRLEYAKTHGPPNVDGDTDENRVAFQANFTIGAHPAHSY